MDRRLGECCDGSNVKGITTNINMRLSAKRGRAQGRNLPHIVLGLKSLREKPKALI
jgi:hypothetical protein